MFKIDRTAFSQEEQSNNFAYWMRKTPVERHEASWNLTCYAYGIDINNPPKLDKPVFSMKKRS